MITRVCRASTRSVWIVAAILAVLLTGIPPAEAAPTLNVMTFAGGGTELGDAGPATSARLDDPRGIAFNHLNGDLLIADSRQSRIRRVNVDGVITTLADGLGEVKDVAVTPDGKVYVATQRDILRLDGNGGFTFIRSFLHQHPMNLEVDPNGKLIYTFDDFDIWESDRIYRINDPNGPGPDEVIAGNQPCLNPYNPGDNWNGDGLVATETNFCRPTSIAFDKGGNLLVFDSAHARIRMIDAATKVVTTVAGTGTFDVSGDGGLATQASIITAGGFAFLPDGTVFFSDEHRIRSFVPGGYITTVAGTGAPGFTGDGGRAGNAQLNQPTHLLARGNLVFVSDTTNDRVRVLTGVLTDREPPTTSVSQANFSVMRPGWTISGVSSDDDSFVAWVVVTFDAFGGPIETKQILLACGKVCSWTVEVPAMVGHVRVTAQTTDTAGNVEPNPPNLSIIVI